jgi:hypothetical protein
MAARPPRIGSDTSSEVAGMQAALVAGFTPAERAGRVRDLTIGASMMAMAGLRSRYPQATEQELLLRLAALRLGADLVARVYGWRAPDDGT